MWQCGRAIENYLLPASAPVAMLFLNPVAASVLTREIFLTFSANFFPVAAVGVSLKNPKDITSTVGHGWVKWMKFSADGIQGVALSSTSARMLKKFACLLLETTVKVMPESRTVLQQLQPLHAAIFHLYNSQTEPRIKLSELKSRFKCAIEGYGASSKCPPDFPLWTVLPQLLSFAASIACSTLSRNLVDECRQVISAVQHALCSIFFKYSSSLGSVAPQQLLFKDCPNGLLCATELINKKSEDKLHWMDVRCVTCGRLVEDHVLRFSHAELQSPGQEQEQFVRALCRIGSIGWHSHEFMRFVHEFPNLAILSEKSCAESLKMYGDHISSSCLSDASAATSCKKCKPYSLKKCCEALPLYAPAITEEANALKASRREELQRVISTLSGSQPRTSHFVGANQALSPSATAGGAALQHMQQPPAKAFPSPSELHALKTRIVHHHTKRNVRGPNSVGTGASKPSAAQLERTQQRGGGQRAAACWLGAAMGRCGRATAHHRQQPPDSVASLATRDSRLARVATSSRTFLQNEPKSGLDRTMLELSVHMSQQVHSVSGRR